MILYTHELLNWEGKPNGVHLGVNEKGICEQAYIEGETTQEITTWFSAEPLLWQAKKDGGWGPATTESIARRLNKEGYEIRSLGVIETIPAQAKK